MKKIQFNHWANVQDDLLWGLHRHTYLSWCACVKELFKYLHLFLSWHIVYVHLLSLDHDREIYDRNLRYEQLMDLIDRYS